MRILLVEDEKPLSAAIGKMLEQEHFALDAALYRPGRAGLRALRQQGVSTPVLMLTARGGVQDRVQGLNLGADYLPAQAL